MSKKPKEQKNQKSPKEPKQPNSPKNSAAKTARKPMGKRKIGLLLIIAALILVIALLNGGDYDSSVGFVSSNYPIEVGERKYAAATMANVRDSGKVESISVAYRPEDRNIPEIRSKATESKSLIGEKRVTTSLVVLCGGKELELDYGYLYYFENGEIRFKRTYAEIGIAPDKIVMTEPGDETAGASLYWNVPEKIETALGKLLEE